MFQTEIGSVSQYYKLSSGSSRYKITKYKITPLKKGGFFGFLHVCFWIICFCLIIDTDNSMVITRGKGQEAEGVERRINDDGRSMW